VFAAALFVAPSAGATSEDEAVAALRAELAALRSDTEARIAELTERVELAEARATAAESTPVATPAAAPASSANAFNPAISLILQGRAAAIDGQTGHRDIPGFLLGDESGVGPDGLSISESELNISANADDKFYGIATIALSSENGETSVELEEAYLQTLALSEGYTLKAGQFFSGIGYLNAKHSHAWDFIDQPLAYEAFLDNQFSDAGVQLSWVAPMDQYLQLGAELFNGDRFPAAGSGNSGFGAYSLFAKTSGEIGASQSWQAGLSYLSADAEDRESELVDGDLFRFSGQSDLWIAELVWKWAPDGNFRERNLLFQAEVFHRDEDGELDFDDTISVVSGDYRGDQNGFYAQTVYQFMPRWRAGVRYDQLWSDNAVSGLDADALDDGSDPTRLSAMLDFSNSEFSRFRLQWNHQWGGLDGNDAFFLQYILSLGSHGAHAY
jgi:hypothetical protein